MRRPSRVEGLAALDPQGVRRIQNPRNSLLLGEGREAQMKALQVRGAEILLRDTRHLTGDLDSKLTRLQPVF